MIGVHISERRSRRRGSRRFLPTTSLGRWAASLATASILTMLAWGAMGPLGGFPSLAFGLAGGIAALVAITRRGERAVSVLLALVPFAGVVLFVLGELIVGH